MRIFVASAAKMLTNYEPNGEGLLAWEILQELAARGHDLEVCARELYLTHPPDFRAFSLGRTLPSNGLDPVAHAFKAAWLFRRMGGMREFDVVYWLRPLDQPHLLFPAVMLSLLPPGMPMVIGPVGLPLPQTARGLDRGITHHLIPPVARVLHQLLDHRIKSDVTVLVATPDAADPLPERWAHRACHVSLGVDEKQFLPAAQPQTPRILCIGTLSEYKGVLELLEAFALVRRSVPGAKLDLVGDGPERNTVEKRVAQPDLQGAVTIHGALPHAMTPALMRSARVLVSASHGEAFGRVLLEAMATARPVIAVRSGGPKALIVEGEGGFLVGVADVDALRERMVRLLQDEALCARMGSFNRRRFEAKHTLRGMVKRLEEEFDAAVHRSVNRR